ncbi:MAG: hypothetical protein KF691_07090 [Phycisphaeraceae bacterium]|nr:hypothetical protein [Phycisphaeraceae bacterium]
MSKRKPQAKRPTRGELYLERVYGPWMHAGTAKVNPREVLALLAKQGAERDARWNEVAHGPRAVPEDCPRAVVLPISRAADILGVEGKSDRFIENYISNGRIAANKLSRQRWKFDLDELERVALDLENERRAARKRRTL